MSIDGNVWSVSQPGRFNAPHLPKKASPVPTVHEVGWDLDPVWVLLTLHNYTACFKIRTYIF
jgi:hypothetical protein